jgi:hypothetical protein
MHGDADERWHDAKHGCVGNRKDIVATAVAARDEQYRPAGKQPPGVKLIEIASHTRIIRLRGIGAAASEPPTGAFLAFRRSSLPSPLPEGEGIHADASLMAVVRRSPGQT